MAKLWENSVTGGEVIEQESPNRANVNHNNWLNVNKRPRQENVNFASLVLRMKNDAEYLPDDSECASTGAWQEDIQALVEAKRQDGKSGFTLALDAIVNLKPRIEVLLDFIEAADPDQAAADQDVRTRAGKNGKRVFIRLTEDDVDLFPDLEFQIFGILPTKAVSLLFGPSGTGKTFMGLHCAQCVGRGIHWFGRRVKPGNVLYVYAEGQLGLKPRLRAWRKYHELGKTDKVTYIGIPVQLKGDRLTLFDTIEDMMATGEKPDLMIIDTFSNCASGVDQSLQKEVAEVLAICHEMKDLYGVHVMLIHHTNKAGDFNGTMAFRNHVDTMIELVTDEKIPNLQWMKCLKQRDGAPKFDDIKLSLKVIGLDIVDVETMQPQTSCVIVPSNSITSKEARAETEAQEQEDMLNVLSLYGELSTAQWKKHSLLYEVSSRAFDKYSKTLDAAKKVKQRTKGKNGTAIYWSLPKIEEETAKTPLTKRS